MIELDNPLLIEFIETGTDTKNRPIIKLWHGRLKHPALTCTPALIAAIGKDPAQLPPGKIPVAALAHWEYSDNTKSTGNPYQDVIRLEPLAPPAAAASDPEALARIEAKIDRLLALVQSDQPSPTEPVFSYFYADGTQATIPEEKTAFNDYRRAHAEKVPANVDALRDWVKARKRATARPLQAQPL